MKKLGIIILLSIGTELFAQENYILDSLEKEFLTIPDIEKKDSLFFNYFMKYAWYKPDSGLVYAQKELLLAREQQLPILESRALGRIGYHLGTLGNYPQGIDYLLRGIKLAEKQKDTSGLDWNYGLIVEIYNYWGDNEQARFYTSKRENLLINVPEYKTELLHGRGVLNENMERLDSALYYEHKALEEDIRLNGKIGRGIIPVTLGGIYYKKKNYPQSRHYFQMGIPNAQGSSYYKDLIQIYNGLAEICLKTGKTDSSSYYAHQALGMRAENAYPLGTLNAYNLLYRLHRQQGNVDSAITYLEYTIALKDSLFDQQKDREVQTMLFNEQLNQFEILAEKVKYKNRIKIYSSVGLAVALLCFGIIQWRNNKRKQKTNMLLREQKAKVEYTLTELKLAQAQLIQSEKMASLGELTAGIAHEIQNPLNFVNNFSEVNRELISELKQELIAGKISGVLDIATSIESNEEKIIFHGKRADAIIKSMLQHSQINNGVKEPTELNALADEYFRLSYHGIRAKDKSFRSVLETSFDQNIAKININAQDIGRVLLNLYNNAFYAVSERDGKGINGFEPKVTVSTRLSSQSVIVSVKDNGNGIPQKVLDKIFQPFFTTKPAGQGTGLGLSLSYDIIKAHGGEIKVETQVGEGSVFIIQLPFRETDRSLKS